jgi:hypothetical protein
MSSWSNCWDGLTVKTPEVGDVVIYFSLFMLYSRKELTLKKLMCPKEALTEASKQGLSGPEEGAPSGSVYIPQEAHPKRGQRSSGHGASEQGRTSESTMFPMAQLV